MKFGAALLVLATTALAQQIRRGDYGDDYDGGNDYGDDYDGGDDYGDDKGGDDYGGGNDYGGGDYGVTKTATTYTTVTTCPVTYTHTKEGTNSTYCVTELTTSTIVVTETKDVEVTIQKPDVTKEYTDVEYYTKTTVCPVTETKTINGEVITKVYTTTKYLEEVVKTTLYDHVKQPDVTEEYTDVVYSTRTSLCPVTVTKTIAGEVITEVYTSTDYIVEKQETTIYDHVKQPDVTKQETDVVYYTKTSLCPVTETKTIEGQVITEVYTSTEYIVEKVETTIYDQVKKPDVTKTDVAVVYHTKTSLCPVTETKTIEGQVVTQVYTSTEYVVEKVETTIPAYETIVKTVGEGVVETRYSKIIKTVGGGTVYATVVPQPTTVELPETQVVTQPEVTVPATPTEAPVEVPTGAAAANKAPVVAFMAGIVGAIALI